MPTKAEFEAAARKLRTAAEQVRYLTTAAQAAGAADILRGGSLGRGVPDGITACGASARACWLSILDGETLCLERAGLIADYESELAVYDVAYSHYEAQLVGYHRDYTSWYYGGGALPHPGLPPVAPPKPASLPAWADVRRP